MTDQPSAEPTKPRTSGLASTAAVFAVLAMASPIFLLLSVPIAVAAAIQIAVSRGRVSGTGTIIFSLGVSCLAWWFYGARGDVGRWSARTAVCLSNQANLGKAMMMYAEDNGGYLPPTASWCTAIRDYIDDPTVFVCPEAPKLKCSYAFNRAFSSRKFREIPGDSILIFESDRGWNASGGAEALPARPRHQGRDHFAFADGHVRMLTRAECSKLRWKP